MAGDMLQLDVILPPRPLHYLLLASCRGLNREGAAVSLLSQACQARAAAWKPSASNSTSVAELLALFFERFSIALQLWTGVGTAIRGIR